MTNFEKIQELTSTIEGMAKFIDIIDLGFDDNEDEEAVSMYRIYRDYMNLHANAKALPWLQEEYIVKK